MSLIYIAELAYARFSLYLCKNTQIHTRTHLRQSGNVEKSDENQETQSTDIAKNSLNFQHVEGERSRENIF